MRGRRSDGFDGAWDSEVGVEGAVGPAGEASAGDWEGKAFVIPPCNWIGLDHPGLRGPRPTGRARNRGGVIRDAVLCGRLRRAKIEDPESLDRIERAHGAADRTASAGPGTARLGSRGLLVQRAGLVPETGEGKAFVIRACNMIGLDHPGLQGPRPPGRARNRGGVIRDAVLGGGIRRAKIEDRRALIGSYGFGGAGDSEVGVEGAVGPAGGASAETGEGKAKAESMFRWSMDGFLKDYPISLQKDNTLSTLWRDQDLASTISRLIRYALDFLV